VFISKKYKTLKDLPKGAVIGSASLRRQAQLLAVYPTLQVRSINIELSYFHVTLNILDD
jgi:hydroxymethylbilane synthase